MPSSTPRMSCGPISDPTHSTRRSWSSRDGPGASGADRMLRQRASSSVLFVPPLIFVFLLGSPWIAIAVAIVTALAAWEVFRLLRAAGYATFAGLGTALAVAVVVDAAAPALLAGSGLMLAAVGLILVGVGALLRPDPRDGLTTWSTTVFGAFYVALLGFVIRLGAAAPGLPESAPLATLGAERGWIALLILVVWAYDTGAYLVGRQYGRHHFLEHISPSKTVEGLVGGLVAACVVAALVLWLL